MKKASTSKTPAKAAPAAAKGKSASSPRDLASKKSPVGGARRQEQGDK